MRPVFLLLPALFTAFLWSACEKEKPNQTEEGPFLYLVYKLDSLQERQGNFGLPATIPAGNAAQSPRFNGIAAHYVELAPNALTQLGNGSILFHHEETTSGGATAIDFSKTKIYQDGDTFLRIPIKDIKAGSYEWLRVSLSYQNYDIHLSANGFNLRGTIASFVGFNQYIRQFQIKDSIISVNANKKQGFWAFETAVGTLFSLVDTGTAPITTVPNPIASTSPIPPGSCVVTGSFPEPLVIPINPTNHMVVEVSLSVNKSFEWKDVQANGVFEPLLGEFVVDMGLRGLKPRLKP